MAQIPGDGTGLFELEENMNDIQFGRSYFLTGCTGFVGREITRQLLSRTDTEFIASLTRGERNDLIRDPRLTYVVGDIVECDFPSWNFTDVIHGANEANDLMQPDLMRYYYTIVEGTERVLRWASTEDSIKRILLLSSGAVARQTVYGRAKYQCERIARHYDRNGRTKVSRIYALIGKEMPLNGQFAIGKFVWQALTERVVKIWGGGSVRSYLGIEDAAAWLIRILDAGSNIQVYDVAGHERISIMDVARRVSEQFDVPLLTIHGPDREDIYVGNNAACRSIGCLQTRIFNDVLKEIYAHLRHADEQPRQGTGTVHSIKSKASSV